MTGHGTKYGAVLLRVGAIRRGTARRAHTRTHTPLQAAIGRQLGELGTQHPRGTQHLGTVPVQTRATRDERASSGAVMYRYSSTSLPGHPAWPARRAAPLSPHLTPPHTTSPPASNANFPSLSLFGFIAHPRPSARGTVQSVQFNSPRGSIKIWMCP